MISLALFFFFFFEKFLFNMSHHFHLFGGTDNSRLVLWKLSFKQTVHHALLVCGTPRAPAMDLNDLTFERPWPMVSRGTTLALHIYNVVGSESSNALAH